jgi:circadian clock protein KaiC
MAVRVSSGVPGLDKLIRGGFERGSLAVLSGGPGTGKTVFCIQFLLQGAKTGENGLFITFEELKEDIIRDAQSFGWDLAPLEKAKKLFVQYYSPFEFEKFLSELEDMITKKDVKRLVIDSTSVFGLYLKDPYEIRKRIWEVANLVKRWGVTAVVTSEVIGATELETAEHSPNVSRFGVEEFVADALFILHYAGLGGDYDRTFQIVKMRRTAHMRGLFPMKITPKGITISPKQTD